VALCLGATGPLYAGYMLNAGYSWRLFFYVCVAFAGALLIAAFIFVEESTYKRKIIIQTPEGEYVKNEVEEEVNVRLPQRKSWRQQLSLMPVVNHDVSYWKTTFRPFTYLIVPAVFWVITTYGIVRSLLFTFLI
jgi:MFS family permease